MTDSKYYNDCFRCGEKFYMPTVVGGKVPCHDCHIEMMKENYDAPVNDKVLP